MQTDVLEHPAAERRPSTPSAKPDAVFTFSKVTWQGAWRREFFASEDRLALSLVRSDRIGRLLICNHSRFVAAKLVRGLTGADHAPFPDEDRISLVEPVWLRRQDPTSIRGVERAFAAYDRRIAHAVRRRGLETPHVITGNPLVAGFCDLSWARSVTWYVIDDWVAHPGYSAWREVYRAAYDRVRVRGLRVVAVSEPLLERLDPSGPSLVLPNGLDPDEWIGEPSVPQWRADLPGPMFIYVGALDRRINVEWIRDLALSEPLASIVFVGNVVAPEHLAPLADLDNVQMRRPIPRRELCALVRSADAGVIPHHVTPLTRAMSPLKLMEYLGAGLPVVATDTAPVRALAHPRVQLVPEGGDFAEAAHRALATGHSPEDHRLMFLAEHSWRARHDQLLDLALVA